MLGMHIKKMKGAFECTHCGACCMKETSPVNVTLGDVKRMSKFLGKAPAELIGNGVRIRPFVDEQMPGRFELELGLPKPCTFWKDARCSIYEARPLNCRLFPFWLYAKLPDETIAEQNLPGYDCVSNSKVDEEHRKIYRDYTRKLGNLIMLESRQTDEFMLKSGFVNEVTLEGRDDEFEQVFAGPGPDTERLFTGLVRAAESKIDAADYEHFPNLLAHELEKNSFASSEQLLAIDGVLAGGFIA